MKHNLHLVLLSAALVVAAATASPQSTKALLPEDAEKAWAEVEKVHAALRPPETWRGHKPGPDEIAAFQQQVRASAAAYADKAQYFLDRFPRDEHLDEARFVFIHALNHAVAAGDPKAEARIAAFVAGALADPKLSENDRARVLLISGNTGFMKKAGMRLFTEGMSSMHEDSERALVEATRAALQRFPSNSMLFTMLVSVAERSKPEQKTELANEIVKAPGAPLAVRTLAEHILQGTQPYTLGRPLDIQYTALDGRAVDLAQMKGKVVLVDFWATDCGPCIAEMPDLKATYDKLHARGFEIVGISLDESETALRRFIREKALPWPQHFDGKGWENKFALRYGIFGIPTMWLVDKRGNLHSTQVRGNLEAQVETLLAESIAPVGK